MPLAGGTPGGTAPSSEVGTFSEIDTGVETRTSPTGRTPEIVGTLGIVGTFAEPDETHCMDKLTMTASSHLSTERQKHSQLGGQCQLGTAFQRRSK